MTIRPIPTPQIYLRVGPDADLYPYEIRAFGKAYPLTEELAKDSFTPSMFGDVSFKPIDADRTAIVRHINEH